MTPARSGFTSQKPLFILPFVILLLVAMFFAARYGGRWGEIDTRNATIAISDMIDSGELAPDESGIYVYPNGYSFQALIVFLSISGGVSVTNLQLFGAALLSIWLVFPAWLLYRELTVSSRAAALATVFLFIQPEFLFPIMRGSHEKFTRGLMLLALYLLSRGIQRKTGSLAQVSNIIAFYLCIYALISFNNLMATSFIVGILITFILLWVISRLHVGYKIEIASTNSRLVYVLIISLILAFVFTFYLYEPAKYDLLIMQSIADRTSALILDVDASATNPYSRWITGAWINDNVYLVVSMANWLLIVASGVLWLKECVDLLIRRRGFAHRAWYILWALCGAFALIGTLSVLADFSGALDATLQHRAFPTFSMIAVALVSKYVVSWKMQRTTLDGIGSIVFLIVIGSLAFVSIVKASNEPAISNKWLFYQQSEMIAVDWINDRLQNRSVWIGYDERLEMAHGILTSRKSPDMWVDYNVVDSLTRDFLVSSIIRVRASRLGVLLPYQADSFLTYDNGETQLFHSRPQTPFQR